MDAELIGQSQTPGRGVGSSAWIPVNLQATNDNLPFPTPESSQADVNVWLAGWLDEHGERGKDVHPEALKNLIQAAPAAYVFHLPAVQTTLRVLHEIALSIVAWRKQHRAVSRPLAAGELERLARYVGRQFPTHLAFLAVHNSEKAKYHVPLFESDYLTLNLHVWKAGEWTSDHDHGPSAGGIAIVRGNVHEEIYAPEGWTSVLRKESEAYSFDASIHRMGRPVEEAGEVHPLSVHAYSGPEGGLVRITSFQREPKGCLTPLRVWRKGEAIPTGGCPCMLAPVCGNAEGAR